MLLIPLIGVLVYLIARGGSMNERAAQQARQQDQEFRSYVQEAAADSPANTADQLAKPEHCNVYQHWGRVETARSHRGWGEIRSAQAAGPGGPPRRGE